MLPQLPRQREGKRAERSHDPESLRAKAPVERTGDKGEQCAGCADADRTVNRLRRSFEALRHDAG